MNNLLKQRSRKLRVWLLVLPALLLPVSFSGVQLVANDTCAEGTCCPEAASWCNIGGDDHFNYYKLESGPCNDIGG